MTSQPIYRHSKEYLISDGSISKIIRYFSDGPMSKETVTLSLTLRLTPGLGFWPLTLDLIVGPGPNPNPNPNPKP